MAIIAPFRGITPPLVGQQFKMQQWYPTVIITCECAPQPTVVTIIGMGTSECKTCGRKYQLNQLDYDREHSDVKINLGMSAPRNPENDARIVTPGSDN